MIAGGTYGTGILATGARVGAKYHYRDAPEEVLERVRELERIASQYGVNLKAAASQFVLAHPAVTSIGVTYEDQDQDAPRRDRR